MKYFLYRDGSTVEGPYSLDWLAGIPLPVTAQLSPETGGSWGRAASVLSNRLPPPIPTRISPRVSAASDATLEPYIQILSRRGFKVGSRTPTNAQMVKPKQFSALAAIICLLLALFPFIIYLIIYAAQKDEIVYLAVEPDGRVVVTTSFNRYRFNLEQTEKHFSR